ncbi:MAG TPA: hypothetical protein VHD56_11330 [Tepidisphaeraceae bacterium]|nr:hypothetical protein [Tepidisphaeraceae bacterium]
MSVRAIKARIVCDKATLNQLWRTHTVFNQRLLPIIGILFKMRRGEVGTTEELRRIYKDIGLYITNYSSQQAEYFLNAISLPDKPWKCSTPQRYKSMEIKSPDGSVREIAFTDWMSQAIELSKKQQLVFDKDKLHGDLPGCIRQMISRESVAIISGHDELIKIWHQEHDKWLKEKAEWEAGEQQRQYLAVKPLFDEFEKSVGGKIRQRRGRWHKYLDFLRSTPQLAAWRGGEAKVNNLDEAALKRVQKARPRKRRSVEAEEFWKINESLRELDKLHGQYEKKFVRRGRPKRNPDGFKHRPTFTEPHPTLHPRWFVFNAPQTNPSGWSDLQIPTTPNQMGSVSLILLTGEKNGDKFPSAPTTVRFKADPRLCDFQKTVVRSKSKRGKSKGQEVDKAAFVWRDRQLNIDRPATIGGIKLIFDVRADGSPSAAFLVFTCDIKSLPLSDRARETKNEFSEEKNAKGKSKFKGRKVPDGLVSMAVDIGIRHVGFATLARWHRDERRIELLRSRNIHLDSAETGSPNLSAIAKHKKTLRRRRGQRGDPIMGETSHMELQQHIDGMADDRFKKAARAIINLALNAKGDINKKDGNPYPRADILILENLANLLPDAEKERGINSALIEFNRGQLVDRVKQLANDVGLKVFEVSPVGTSQVCHVCGSLGRRYSIRREAENRGERASPVIHFGPTDSLFACPKCPAKDSKHADAPFTCNSDYNAARNLQRRFYLDNDALSAYPVGQAKKAHRDSAYASIDPDLNKRLRKLHGLPEIAAVQVPW